MEEDQEKQPRKQKELQHFALDEADNIIDIKDVETPLLPQSTFRLPS